MYHWLTEKPWCSEKNYPNQIEYSSLKILSGSQQFPTEPCILRSSIGTAKFIQKQCRQNVAMFLGRKADSFDFVSFAKQLGSYGLNQHFELFPLWQLRNECRLPLYWMRSNDGFKKISGQRIDRLDQLDELEVSDSAICVVAPLKEIGCEFRYVVCDGKIIDGSQYLPDEGPDDPNTREFAQKVVDAIDEPPDAAYILDATIDANGKRWAVEFNAFSTSGLYGCNIPLVCEVIEKMLDQENDPLD